MPKEVDRSNIQGSIWPRLPRYYETFLFFKIKDVDDFKEHLSDLVDSGKITTGAQCESYLKRHGGGLSEAREKPDIHPDERHTFNAINVAFTGKGVLQLVGEYTELRLRDLLHDRGMYQDLVYEGADHPDHLNPEYKPPSDHPTGNSDWRNDGIFIVATQRKKELDQTVTELKEYFCVGKDKASIEITTVKEGQARNADGKAKRKDGENLHGKEHFGFEDEISQPQIIGLDDPPGEGEPKAIPPGWILLGHEGDNTHSPEWANDGSYLVFREIEENVPEFNKFLRESSKTLKGFDDANGEERLAAHLMGRWKNGSPVALDRKDSEAQHPYSNKFEYRQTYKHKDEVYCPFAAHIRKMRPRADLYVGANGDEEVTVETNTVNNSNVILRRSITFGPEMSQEEVDTEKQTQKRGIYFCCYQGDLRNGFNLLITRWASNKVFASKKGFSADPGVDPIISQTGSRDKSTGTFSIFEKGDKKEPTSLPLNGIPWISQRGGEYFFTPSLKALRTVFVEELP